MLSLSDIKSVGGYDIVYADPPWTYNDKALAGNRGAGCKYSLMSNKEICELPVQELAAKDCALFMWVTFPKLQDGLNVIKAWGFEYKTVAFTWVKTYPKAIDKFFFGMGRWTRANAEICLLATKGKPKRLDAGVSQIIVSPIRKHSQKPDETRDRIVRLMGDLPRLEMFSRVATPGWHVWGNQVESDIILEGV